MRREPLAKVANNRVQGADQSRVSAGAKWPVSVVLEWASTPRGDNAAKHNRRRTRDADQRHRADQGIEEIDSAQAWGSAAEGSRQEQFGM